MSAREPDLHTNASANASANVSADVSASASTSSPTESLAAEVWLRQILDNSTALVYVKDSAGRHLFANRRLLDLFGLEESQVVGRTDAEIFPPETAANYRHNDMAVLADGKPSEFEERARLPDGEHVYLSVKFPLNDASGKPYAVCGISTDITERKRIEQALSDVALGVTGATGQDIFQSIARHLAACLGVDFAFVGKLIEGPPRRIQTLAISSDGHSVDNMQYDLVGTPCQTVVGQEFQYVPQEICTCYPGDNMLSRMGFESYAGYPLFDSQGEALGLIAVLHRGPLRAPEFIEAILRIFSVRAASELERLRTEDAQRASEASYRAIFEASQDAIFVHDIDTGAIVDLNPTACRAYGYAYEEMLGLGIEALSSGVHPYTLEQATKHLEKVKAGVPQRFEWHRRNKDGSLHWDEVLLHRATIGGIDRIVAFTREITERKAREAALTKSEDRLRATIEAALDCIVAMDSDGRVIEFNPAAERCFGYSRAQVLGHSLVELMVPERHRARHYEALAQYRATNTGPFLGRRIDVIAMRADGSEFPAELAITAAQGQEGDILIGYLRDITERQQAEAERGRLEAQLRQAQKMEAIGHLTGGIAHDFNNILTGVMGYIVLAEERVAPLGDTKLSSYLERAQRSSRRARDLIQQMLTFSRGQRGEPRPLQLAPLIKETVKLLGATLPSSVEIRTRLDADAPPALLDPVQVEQVLMNLCINARDAMQGSGHIEVRLRLATYEGHSCASCRQPVSGRFLELSVSDDGPGIAPDVLERMFEPFFSTKEVGKGSGMGLATVHGILHELGGHILVESAPDAGARFRVVFPPLSGAAESIGAADATALGAQHTPLLGGRVLVVDDDEVAGDFMGDLLETWGLTPTVVRESPAALERFRERPDAFDLAVLDQTMPRMTGLQLAAQLRTLNPDLPIVLYSGYSEGITEAQLRAAGVAARIRKPVDHDELLPILRGLLRDRH